MSEPTCPQEAPVCAPTGAALANKLEIVARTTKASHAVRRINLFFPPNLKTAISKPFEQQ